MLDVAIAVLTVWGGDDAMKDIENGIQIGGFPSKDGISQMIRKW